MVHSRHFKDPPCHPVPSPDVHDSLKGRGSGVAREFLLPWAPAVIRHILEGTVQVPLSSRLSKLRKVDHSTAEVLPAGVIPDLSGADRETRMASARNPIGPLLVSAVPPR